MKYIIDLDDTLVGSTRLNNDAYNYALEKHGYDRVKCGGRITRNNLSKIDTDTRAKIIQDKQQYFSADWLPYRIVKNKHLIKKLAQVGKSSCYLWTKADKDRAINILQKCGLTNLFQKIIFDNKIDFANSIAKIKALTNSNEFVIYEDNYNFFECEKVKIVDKIINDTFAVIGYYVAL